MTHPDTREERTWLRGQQDEWKVMLVEAPLTFGHSQLRLTCAENPPEEDRFRAVHDPIATCIKRFRERLPDLVLRPEFRGLRHYTWTSGEYLKTLVVRSSANEGPCEYKVHLVPYFESHARRAEERHRREHRLPAGKKGGLLGWLGARESQVDADIEVWRDTDDFPSELVTALNLETLAGELK